MNQNSNFDASRRLHDLFKEDWEWSLEHYPESATHLGNARYNDRLTDLSAEAIEQAKAHEREMFAQIQRIDRTQLEDQDAISYDLFLLDKKLHVESQRFPLELMPVTQMDGPQIAFGQLVASMPFDTVKDYDNYIRRLEALPRYLDQVVDLMRRGIEAGWTAPSVPLRSVPSQIEGQIFDDPTTSTLHVPFKRFPQHVTSSERDRLLRRAETVIRDQVMAALRKFDGFVRDTYLRSTRAGIAASTLKDGADYYQYCIRRLTTTDLTPQEIHEIGQTEVARIRNRMEELIRNVGFSGSFHDFLKFLRTDPRFYYDKPQDLVIGYAVIAKRMDAELPRLFAELPRTPYGVREVPEYEAPAQTTAYYLPGAADGSRAGYFYVNTYKLETRPKYEMEALTLHESVPGHHLQIARAQELKGLPDFRRNGTYTAYVEGWGLYAESLGSDIDFYSDDYSRFGQLTYEMWRACRLVIDTGIHALGWTRQQAIDYMLANTAKTENDVIVEIDRYIVWPAQALAYKLGELKIKELRRKANAALNERFDIRRFHNAILDSGPLPLTLLETQIDKWISAVKSRGPKAEG